jgi:23S rRNA U2552 (ribose-2'-O)-methylase RlmE/FtsJ
MTYYQLPRIPFIIHKYIDYIESEESPSPAISNSLSFYLYDIKEKLDKREKDWDIYKKYTNPYEYIHTVIPFKKKCVSKFKPLSRSYFKMIEIIHTFELYFDSKPLKSFHLAEGPGGFIEAIASLRKNPNDNYYGMTILDDKNDPNIPAWKKTDAFLRNNKNVIIETGADKTGNILSIENFVYCKEKYGSSMDFITADGGFDFSLDFNKQEINIANLLFAQIVYALVMQKKGGSFVLKIFDSFMQHTVDLLFILSSFYDKVYIIKPQTSRYANSEKYIVCKGFILPTCQYFFPFLHRAFEKMSMPSEKEVFISRFLSIPVSYFFTSRIEEYNAIFGQQQIENIHYTISLIDNKNKQEKIDNLIKTNIQKCVAWCMKYNVLHNIFSPTTTNIFLSTPSGTNLRIMEEDEFIETF